MKRSWVVPGLVCVLLLVIGAAILLVTHREAEDAALHACARYPVGSAGYAQCITRAENPN